MQRPWLVALRVGGVWGVGEWGNDAGSEAKTKAMGGGRIIRNILSNMYSHFLEKNNADRTLSRCPEPLVKTDLADLTDATDPHARRT